MAITLVGTPQVGAANNGGAVTLTFDGSPAEDDVVVLVGGNADDDGAGAIGPSTAGYTQRALYQTNDGTNISMGVWTKPLGASPDATVIGLGSSDNAEATAYAAFVLRGVDVTTPIDVAIESAGPETTAGLDLPAVVTVTDGAWVIAAVCRANSTLSGGAPTGYSNFVGAAFNDTNPLAVAAASKEVATAGSENPDSFSFSNSRASYGFTIAIRPAGAAGGQDLTGTLFSSSPVFFSGTLTAGPVALVGILFVAPPAFLTGSIVSPVTLLGSVFNKPPQFISGSLVRSATVQYLFTPETVGHWASTPDTAALDITADIDIRADIEPEDWLSSGGETVIILGKWQEIADQLSFVFGFAPTGAVVNLVFVHSDDGASPIGFAISDSLAASGRLQLRVTLDADNGSSQHVVTFYHRNAVTSLEDNSGWTQLSQHTVAGATSIFSGSAPLGILSIDSGDLAPFAGRSYQATVMNGINGTIVTEFNADDFNLGDSDSDTAVDSTGKTWTIHGAGSFISEPGAATSLSGLLFSSPPAFAAGTIISQVALLGSVFSKPPQFSSGSIVSAVTLAGALFNSPPTFLAGTLTSVITLEGILFLRPPVFTPGLISAGNELAGNLFSSPPSFASGALVLDQAISGQLFSSPATFVSGTLSAGNVTLSGVVFSSPPLFASGSLTAGNVVISGITFTSPPSFGQGFISAGGVALQGTLFSSPPTFLSGELIAGNVTISGVLFVSSPEFLSGQILSAQVVVGGLFSSPPVFLSGSINSIIGLAGNLFSSPPTFPQGQLSAESVLLGVVFNSPATFLSGQVGFGFAGVVFSPPPTFLSGSVRVGIAGATFSSPPTFLSGLLSIDLQVLSGVLFDSSPTFLLGAIISEATLSPGGLRDPDNIAREPGGIARSGLGIREPENISR